MLKERDSGAGSRIEEIKRWIIESRACSSARCLIMLFRLDRCQGAATHLDVLNNRQAARGEKRGWGCQSFSRCRSRHGSAAGM